MHIFLVTSTLATGGSERVISSMANYWAAQGQDITLVTLSNPATDWYALDGRVTRVGLDLCSNSSTAWHALVTNFRRIHGLHQAIRASNPDVIISFLTTVNVLTLMARIGLQVPVVISERTDPRQHRLARSWEGLRRMLYCWADAVVVQTNAVSSWARTLVRPDAVHIIPNAVAALSESFPLQPDIRPLRKTVMAMGRLSKEKGFDLLLHAFARCVSTRTGWRLEILGDGAERATLETLAGTLGVTDQLHFHGRVSNPTTILTRADLFVLSSRYEGFPNALLEAMACGIAVVATDCPSGPRDIIRDGIDGLLVSVENVDALSDAMGVLMDNPQQRASLGKRAREVSDRFSFPTVMGMWEALLQTLHETHKGIPLTDQRLQTTNNRRFDF